MIWLTWAAFPAVALFMLGLHRLVTMPGRGGKPAARKLVRREPRDKARPLLHAVTDLDDAADPRLSVCPVCGMDGDEVTLDGKFCGAWPAHATCVEWAGEWKPSGEVPRKVPHEVLKTLANLRATAAWQDYLAVERQTAQALGISQAALCGQFTAAVGAGILSLDEAREAAHDAARANDQWMRSFGIPMAQMGDSRVAQVRWCICGDKFSGTWDEIHALEAAHISSGTCALHKHPSR
ncbi:MAG TPA: hypothetical protein VNF47_04105 [Streptosporangiaceae bacterium]|nr:hypothetical protein [Streptosporangiaceae bacterium]